MEPSHPRHSELSPPVGYNEWGKQELRDFLTAHPEIRVTKRNFPHGWVKGCEAKARRIIDQHYEKRRKGTGFETAPQVSPYDQIFRTLGLHPLEVYLKFASKLSGVYTTNSTHADLTIPFNSALAECRAAHAEAAHAEASKGDDDAEASEGDDGAAPAEDGAAPAEDGDHAAEEDDEDDDAMNARQAQCKRKAAAKRSNKKHQHQQKTINAEDDAKFSSLGIKAADLKDLQDVVLGTTAMARMEVDLKVHGHFEKRRLLCHSKKSDNVMYFWCYCQGAYLTDVQFQAKEEKRRLNETPHNDPAGEQAAHDEETKRITKYGCESQCCSIIFKYDSKARDWKCSQCTDQQCRRTDLKRTKQKGSIAYKNIDLFPVNSPPLFFKKVYDHFFHRL